MKVDKVLLSCNLVSLCVVKMASELLIWSFVVFFGPSLCKISLVRDIAQVMEVTNVKLLLKFSFEREKRWMGVMSKTSRVHLKKFGI